MSVAAFVSVCVFLVTWESYLCPARTRNGSTWLCARKLSERERRVHKSSLVSLLLIRFSSVSYPWKEPPIESGERPRSHSRVERDTREAIARNRYWKERERKSKQLVG